MTEFRLLYQEAWQPLQGERLQVEIFEAGEGTPASYVRQIVELNYAEFPPVWPGLADRVFLERVLKGAIVRESQDCFFIVKSGGHVVGVTALQHARQTPDLGSFGWVATHPDFRGRGISTFLGGLTIHWFLNEGGVCLHLGTVNPIAHHIYAKLGFRDDRGIVMRYVAPAHKWQAFDQILFRSSASTPARLANAGDAAGLGALYVAPSPCFVKDYGEGLYSTLESDARRYASVPASLFLRMEQRKGRIWVLENDENHIVGAANVHALDSTLQKHVYHLDFLVHPGSFNRTTTLLEAVIQYAHQDGVGTLRTHVATGDDEKRAVLLAAGFQEGATYPGQLRSGEQEWGLTIFDLAG